MAKKIIFIVEDDPDIARLVSLHLEASDFAPRIFSRGHSVLTEAERQRPKLFILDVVIPGRDGFELCRAIRSTASISRIPIIFLSARSAEPDRIRGLEIGGDDYVSKPFSPKELISRVKAVLRRYAPARELRFAWASWRSMARQ